MKKLGRKFVQVVAQAVVPLVLKSVVVLLEEILQEDINKDGVVGFGKAKGDGKETEVTS